jgi:hypothetical protein
MPKTARPVNLAPADGEAPKSFNRPDDPRYALIHLSFFDRRLPGAA